MKKCVNSAVFGVTGRSGAFVAFSVGMHESSEQFCIFFSSLFVTLFLLLDGVHQTPQTSNLIKTVIQYQFDQTTYR